MIVSSLLCDLDVKYSERYMKRKRKFKQKTIFVKVYMLMTTLIVSVNLLNEGEEYYKL